MKKYINPMLEIVKIQTLDIMSGSGEVDPEAGYPVDDIAAYSGFLRQ